MNSKIVVFLVCLGVGPVWSAIENECAKERVAGCMAEFLSSLAEDATSVQKTCSDLNAFVACFRGLVDECELEDDDVNIQKEIAELEAMVDKDCKEAAAEAENDSDECVAQNTAYVSRCLHLGTEQAMTFFGALGPLNLRLGEEDRQNLLSCSIFASISSCVVERVKEKCGEEASDAIFQDLIKQMPSDVTDSCDAVRRNPELLELLPRNDPMQVDERK